MSAVMADIPTVAEVVAKAMDVRRYGREVSAMTPRNRFVHQVLCQLYDHPAMRGASGHGMTAIARLMEFGPMGAGQVGSTVPLELPEHLLVVREAVNHLGPRMKSVIGLSYGVNEPIYSIARTLSVSEAVARSLLKHARPIIGSFLAGKGVRLPSD